jgi:1,4-dihydroxy-2-naphthoate octaprenyltransferase
VGQIRAVLWHHLATRSPHVPAAPESDPNDLLSAEPFVAACDELRLHRGDAGLEEAGASYVALWARTFRSLVRHLRGQPGHALQMWTHDVYPYLRGDLLAARAEKRGPQNFDVLVHDDLPAPYVAGMLRAFLQLARVDVEIDALGGGRFHLQYKIPTAERALRIAYMSAQLRIPLLITSLLAALVGTLFAWRHNGPATVWLLLATLSGAIAAQSGANAIHDLAKRRPRPMAAPGPSRSWLLFQAIGSYAVAAASMGIVIAGGRPGIIAYAILGLLLGVMYRSLRDEGWGPFIAGLSHGPLTVWGAYHAIAGPVLLATPAPALLIAMPTGLIAAAILYLDDLADRPLDEAAGKRTLVVRLPRRRHVAVFAGLLVAAMASASIVVAWEDTRWLAASGGLAIGAAIIVQTVRRNLDDPHGLAPARMAMLLLFAATVALMISALGVGA